MLQRTVQEDRRVLYKRIARSRALNDTQIVSESSVFRPRRSFWVYSGQTHESSSASKSALKSALNEYMWVSVPTCVPGTAT